MERDALNGIYESQLAVIESKRKELDTIDDDGAWEAAMNEVDRLIDESHKTWLKCFAAQFHKCKNEWFNAVIARYPTDTVIPISEKQFYVFSQYASDTDSNAWRTKEQYCRCGEYLVTLKWKNSNRSIKKQYIG